MNDNEKNEVHDSKNVGTWTIRHHLMCSQEAHKSILTASNI